jgi:hypothetical protein
MMGITPPPALADSGNEFSFPATPVEFSQGVGPGLVDQSAHGEG